MARSNPEWLIPVAAIALVFLLSKLKAVPYNPAVATDVFNSNLQNMGQGSEEVPLLPNPTTNDYLG